MTVPVVPTDAAAIVEHYLQLVDRTLPGQLVGLYLTGSIALDDYQPGRSDVDFVAVTEDTLTAPALDRLEQAHWTLTAEHSSPRFSGIYVTWADLARNPVGLTDIPFHLEGHFGRTDGFEANPSIWLTLRRYPVAVRGPRSPVVWHDLAILEWWNRENLNTYWRGWMSGYGRPLGRSAPLLRDEAIAWAVPGVARLHFTITTGNVTSKAGACRYVLERFPDHWHPIAREALAIRNGESTIYRDRRARGRDALAFMRFVIDSAAT